MADIRSYTAVIGRTLLVPGILPVRTTSPSGPCLVAHAYPATIEDPERGIKLDVSDCTVFTVTHQGLPDRDWRLPEVADELLEQALQAISEVTVWTKAKDEVGSTSAFLRQHGRLDVKFFLLSPSSDVLIAWRNPLFWTDRGAAALIAGFLGNMVMANGPAASPLPPITRRAMNSLDLINLGFYTEAFVGLFSLAMI